MSRATLSPVLLRAVAIVCALAIPLLLMIGAVSSLVGPWLGPALAAVCALPLIFVAREHRSQAVVGAALAALAAGLSPQVPELLQVSDPASVSVLDLRLEPLSSSHAQRRDYVNLRGYLRTEWVIDEYPGGVRPDQNERPKAVLVPLLGTEGALVEAGEGLVVVARVMPELLEAPTLQTLRGRIGPVAPELVEALFAVQASGQAQLSQPPAVLLDTLDAPTRGEAWTRAALAGGAAGLALLLLLTALPPFPKAPEAPKAPKVTP